MRRGVGIFRVPTRPHTCECILMISSTIRCGCGKARPRALTTSELSVLPIRSVARHRGYHHDSFRTDSNYRSIIKVFRARSQGLTSDVWNLRFEELARIEFEFVPGYAQRAANCRHPLLGGRRHREDPGGHRPGAGRQARPDAGASHAGPAGAAHAVQADGDWGDPTGLAWLESVKLVPSRPADSVLRGPRGNGDHICAWRTYTMVISIRQVCCRCPSQNTSFPATSLHLGTCC